MSEFLNSAAKITEGCTMVLPSSIVIYFWLFVFVWV
jgi:hypothetical protein